MPFHLDVGDAAALADSVVPPEPGTIKLLVWRIRLKRTFKDISPLPREVGMQLSQSMLADEEKHKAGTHVTRYGSLNPISMVAADGRAPTHARFGRARPAQQSIQVYEALTFEDSDVDPCATFVFKYLPRGT